MNTLPLAKKEINTLKWVTLFVLLWEILVLASLRNTMVGRVNGWSVTKLWATPFGSAPFFAMLPSTSFMALGVVVLSFVQFYGINKAFLFSLPVRGGELFATKLMAGLASCTLWVLAYGAGLAAIWGENRYWLEDLYVHYPEDIYRTLSQNNGLGVLLLYLLLLWLSVAAMYLACVFFQTALKNKIAAGVLSFAALWYPSFLSGRLWNSLWDFYRNNGQYDNRNIDLAEKITQEGIGLLSLPENPRFTSEPATQLVVSYVNGIEEMEQLPYAYVVDHVVIKFIIAAGAAGLFAWLAFRCFPAGRRDERKTVRRLIILGVVACVMIVLCHIPSYVRLNLPMVEYEPIVSELERISVNQEKTIDTGKYSAFARLDDFLFEYTDYSEDNYEETRRKTLALFDVGTPEYCNIQKRDEGLNFAFRADDFLSKGGVPAALENQGFEGLQEFIARSEVQFQELVMPEGGWGFTQPYYYYDSGAKALIVYYISSYLNSEERDYEVSLHILFGSALSYPNAYMDEIKGLESETNYFSAYCVNGHKDVLMFENQEFAAYVSVDRYFYNDIEHRVSEYPLKAWLYGKDGMLESLKLAVVVPAYAVVENTDLTGMDPYLELMNATQEDKTNLREAVKNALGASRSGRTQGQLTGCEYDLRTAKLRGGDSKFVEVVVRGL